MRVIAGIAGGLELEVPRHGVRPTMDKVKGAIFSSLGEKVIGARVLDLFAGAGGLGIEALSRGAASALFVEANGAVAAVIERNLVKASLAAAVRVQDVFEFLRHAPETFDIIFADPPYDRTSSGEGHTELLLNDPHLPQALAEGGLFVLEKRPGERLPSQPAWELVRARKYGATEALFFAPAT